VCPGPRSAWAEGLVCGGTEVRGDACEVGKWGSVLGPVTALVPSQYSSH